MRAQVRKSVRVFKQQEQSMGGNSGAGTGLAQQLHSFAEAWDRRMIHTTVCTMTTRGRTTRDRTTTGRTTTGRTTTSKSRPSTPQIRASRITGRTRLRVTKISGTGCKAAYQDNQVNPPPPPPPPHRGSAYEQQIYVPAASPTVKATVRGNAGGQIKAQEDFWQFKFKRKIVRQSLIDLEKTQSSNAKYAESLFAKDS